MDIQTFSVVDYVVFGLTVLVSISIGVYFAVVERKHQTTLNFFHGDRKLRYGPVALSLVVTFQSSIMLLGFPAEVYLFGFMIVLFCVGQCAAIYISTCIIVPLMYPLKITSVYHYLQLRYKNSSVRILSVTIGILSQAIYMGSVLFGPAIALQSVTDTPVWASILCIAVAAVVYTSIGGILAVVWTDVLQCVIINIGIIAMLVKGTIDAGGVSNVIKHNLDSQRLDIFKFNPDPTIRHTFWTLIIGSFVGSFSLTLSQSTIQRFNSTPNIKDAMKVLYIAGPVFIVMQTMSMAVGLVCFAYYSKIGCDPLKSGHIKNPNQIVPFMIVDIFSKYPGLSGLFISALFSASLSTLSSLLSGLSAITVEDLVRPYVRLSDTALTRVAKIAVVGYGGLGISVAFIISQLEGSLTQILFGIMGAATGPIVGIFFLSMFYSRATDKGAIAGGIVGLVLSFWICIGATVSRSLPKPVPLPLPPTNMCFVDLDTETTLGLANVTNSTSIYTDISTLITTFNILNVTDADVQTSITSLNAVDGIDKIYMVSYALIATIGTLVTVVVGLLVSLVTYNEERDKADPRYIISVYEQMCCCLQRARGPQRTAPGVDFKSAGEEIDCSKTLLEGKQCNVKQGV
ncbi:sodium-coupled monocarboxylate transporter 1-like [Mya arenaria]|uniref:sodium-coupled monocarboxylate transporter 1-like n=1 Tax=Mya arenaria TaxID=6604 RepID=UPI0022E8C5CE|nr:sodium-coupled monocarboxylate transporter 1-like [Mya arenaria]